MGQRDWIERENWFFQPSAPRPGSRCNYVRLDGRWGRAYAMYVSTCADAVLPGETRLIYEYVGMSSITLRLQRWTLKPRKKFPTRQAPGCDTIGPLSSGSGQQTVSTCTNGTAGCQAGGQAAPQRWSGR